MVAILSANSTKIIKIKQGNIMMPNKIKSFCKFMIMVSRLVVGRL